MDDIIQLGNLVNSDKRDYQRGRVYASSGISPALNACQGGGHQPKIVVGCASRKRGSEHGIEMRKDNVSNALTTINTDSMIMAIDNSVEREGYRIAIRKLTPWEFLRHMGVSEENIAKAKTSGISNTQIYKMAGNSIVVHQLAPILEQIFYPETQRGEQLKLF